MSNRSGDGTNHSDSDLLEREAEALVEMFNGAAADYSPDIEWFGMSHDIETGEDAFVLEAAEYIDNDGLDALRDHGRIVQYIEAYEVDGDVAIQIEIPVRDTVPGEDRSSSEPITERGLYLMADTPLTAHPLALEDGSGDKRLLVECLEEHLAGNQLDRLLRELSLSPYLGDSIPEIVCLCGSTRFKDEYLREQERLTMEGKIFHTVGMFGHSDDVDLSADEKEMLDELHKRKIDLADRVHVIDVDGYIGDSTRAEIEYAERHGIPVTRYSEREADQ